MLELTQEECIALENRVLNKLRIESDNKEFDDFHTLISRIAIIAAITTIREYERMKDTSEAPQ